MHKISISIILAFLLIVCLRLLFSYTDYIQEDAFISWRCAENIAYTGTYGFNSNEKVSASTTHLYVFISAGIKFITGAFFIPVILSLNFLVLIAGIYLIAESIFQDFQKKIILWFLVSISPFAFTISASGMETPYVILFIGILAFGLRYEKTFLSILALVLFPWLRLDSVAICLIFLAGHYYYYRRFPLTLLTFLIIGIVSVMLFNYLYFGDVVNQTIIAKKIAYKTTYRLNLPKAAYRVFLENGGLFSPFYSRFLTPISGLFVALTLSIGTYYIQRNRIDREKTTILLILFSIAIIIPLFYVAGGIIFEWYLWPSSLAAFCLIAAWATDFVVFKNSKFSQYALGAATLVIVLTCAAEWRQKLYLGTYELYRKNLGLYLKSITHPSDTLMLEPAGYIPYFSNLYTYDEIGLTSPVVSEYRKKFAEGWWIQFLKDKKPTYLIQRSPMRQFITLDEYSLNKTEKEWFVNNYKLTNEFLFDYHEVRSDQLSLYLLKGSIPVKPFYLYTLRSEKKTL